MKIAVTLTLLLSLAESVAAGEPRFTDRVRERAAGIWEQEMDHPFVKGLGDGSLPLQKFKYYLRQDYRFLVDYARVMALAVARAGDVATMIRFSDSLSATLKGEMEAQRRFAQRLGISAAELESTVATPTTYAYTRHLLLVAEKGSLPEVLAAVLPCAWGYYEIATRLAEKGPPSEHPFYAEWIGIYANDESRIYVEELRVLLDSLVEGMPEAKLAELEEIFLTSSRYELLFWEMSYREEDWP
jgi:thiaminase/transcriptional activator TenA